MLNENISELFLGDNIYIRKDKNKVKRTMRLEFEYILETQFGEFNEDDFEGVIENDECNELEEFGDSLCICTKNIKQLCYIRHIDTGIIFQVGSSCFKKISSDAYTEYVSEKRRLKKERECRFEFGKYKGRLVSDIVQLDRNYCNWMLTNAKKTFIKKHQIAFDVMCNIYNK